MPLSLRWTDQSDLELLAQTRVRCYGSQAKDLDKYREMIRNDHRPGESLLAELDGEGVGTAMSLAMTMWARGAAIPCQGVAWVGTTRAARRGADRNADGVATQLMREILRRAHDRQQVVSALMPFRASFYEHFGYGLVEKRHEWTIPLSILPRDGSPGLRYYRDADEQAVSDCRQRQVQGGQCDIETSAAAWKRRRMQSGAGFEIVDRPDADGAARGWMHLMDQTVDGKRMLRVVDNVWDSMDSLKRQLAFLSSQRDQYSAAIVELPVDLPVNHLLRESQVAHRPVEHAAAGVRYMTRMQVRILDHLRFLNGLNLPAGARGSAVLAVRESEGHLSTFRIELAGGRCQAAASSASPDVECRDIDWATIACGAVSATSAARAGMISAKRPQALALLDELAAGPAPFCNEYF